ncbi:mannosyltransferase family protein [Streptomyces sp. NPDC006283]|uniref:mannosyltransferase family protein n=1 Tax=Streptomyces sp. NPDC006283 TaxID=3156741 RepID=UPI0033B9F3C6
MTLPPPQLSRPRPARHQPPHAQPPPTPGALFRDRARSWLGPADREVLWLYLLTRLSLWVTAYCTRWLFPGRSGTREPDPVLASFEQWDWHHYLQIARDGYFPDQSGPAQGGDRDNREAFFPGFPLMLRAVHVVVPHWTAAGLLISFVAGAVAVLALARLARRYLPDARGERRTVLFFLLSPCAVFLAAGYTEALFLSLALPAWLAALRHSWPLAAGLTALATTVRVSGLFLAAAVALHFLLVARTRAHWRALPWLALPAAPAALYAWYLHAHTGDWLAWNHAQERGWHRTFHAPWDTWSVTWNSAFDRLHGTGYAFMFQAELVTMVVGLVLCVVLVRRRRWPEAAYIGLTLAALGTSYWYMSIPRSTLLWWPLWIGLASWSLRRPRLTTVWLCLVGPLSTVFAMTFLSGRWTG